VSGQLYAVAILCSRKLSLLSFEESRVTGLWDNPDVRCKTKCLACARNWNRSSLVVQLVYWSSNPGHLFLLLLQHCFHDLQGWTAMWLLLYHDQESRRWYTLWRIKLISIVYKDPVHAENSVLLFERHNGKNGVWVGNTVHMNYDNIPMIN
jgi:hypothetical protein